MDEMEKALRQAARGTTQAHEKALADKKVVEKVSYKLRGGPAGTGSAFERGESGSQGNLGRWAERRASEVADKTYEADQAAWNALDKTVPGAANRLVVDMSKAEKRKKEGQEGAGAQA